MRYLMMHRVSSVLDVLLDEWLQSWTRWRSEILYHPPSWDATRMRAEAQADMLASLFGCSAGTVFEVTERWSLLLDRREVDQTTDMGLADMWQAACMQHQAGVPMPDPAPWPSECPTCKSLGVGHAWCTW